MKYTIDDIRNKWFDFWKSKDHVIIPSASILPDNDPTALFHNSGMHPLVPYLMGEAHPQGQRLADVQKCIRTIDIDEVGDATHLTFFEMLGNWSLGDYFKAEQIEWSFEFLTQVLGLPLEKLAVSVFEGDENAPRDDYSAERWQEVGMSAAKIAFLPASENWWAKGETGPCGPDTEMFYWTGEEPAPDNFQASWEDERWVEIWNDVFMQFNKDAAGTLTPLPSKNIDTGMGLERTVAVINGLKSVYQTDAFAGILQKIADLSGHQEIASDPIGTSDSHHSSRIIADHVRTSVVMLSDGVTPSNVDQGYILRRIIRRAIRHGRKLGIDQDLCVQIAAPCFEKLASVYENLAQKQDFILEELAREEAQFRKTLEAGEREFKKLAEKLEGKMPGEKAFYLYETYGFPIEMTVELASEQGLEVDEAGFHEAYKAHQALSRAGAEQKFSGGLADRSEETVKLHTATHLMHAALRKILGDHVQQKGSNITADRLRFDFSHEEKLTPEQLQEVEDYVNQAIDSDAPVEIQEMSVEEAKDSGALGFFEHKYGDKVKVYTMGDHSKEICGGPHVEHLGQLGGFKIKKQESCGRGVRRIKATVG